MIVLEEPVEVGGLIIKHCTAEELDVYDLNYGNLVGHLIIEEGPGWILKLSDHAGFLDIGQMRSLVEFADKHLKIPEESNV